MKFKAVLFDLDGTLLNTLTDLTDAVNHTLSAHGYPLRTEAEIRGYLGNGARDLLTRSLPDGTEASVADELLPEYLCYYSAHSQDKTAPYGGIARLLAFLEERGVKMAVVSNKGDAQVKPLVKRYFPSIPIAIGENASVAKKPDPSGVLQALRLLGTEACDAAYMGDSDVDGITANNAGLAFLAACWGFRDRDELQAQDPVRMLDEPEDLIRAWEE